MKSPPISSEQLRSFLARQLALSIEPQCNQLARRRLDVVLQLF
jgi:hypothetical protein